MHTHRGKMENTEKIKEKKSYNVITVKASL